MRELKYKYNGASSVLKMAKEEGYRGLYWGTLNYKNISTCIGYSISVFCIPLFHTLYFPIYEKLKLIFADKY